MPGAHCDQLDLRALSGALPISRRNGSSVGDNNADAQAAAAARLKQPARCLRRPNLYGLTTDALIRG